ncbi:MAG: DNRLRE domain-containing protein [Lachnospiraceae bacterium]|nr:DNRLRE domain-containing protein [Lachnospiraceae bacterium]
MSANKKHYRNKLILMLAFVLAFEHPLAIFASENTTPEAVLDNTVSEGEIPGDGISDDNPPEEAVPEDMVSEDTIPEESTSKNSVPPDTVSGNVSNNSASDNDISGNSVSNNSLSEDEIPDGYYADEGYEHYEMSSVSPDDLLHELPRYRSENVKVYEHPDHSVTAYYYAEPVNYERSDGSFATIDNRLHFSEGSSENKVFAGYTNTSAPFRLRFAQAADERKLFDFSDDTFEVSFIYVPSSKTVFNTDNISVSSSEAVSGNTVWKTPAELIDTEANEKKHSDEAVITAAGGEDDAPASNDTDTENPLPVLPNPQTVLYENIENGVTLRYLPISDGVKETIVVSRNDAPSVYTFDLNVRGLKAVMEEGNILLNDSDGQTLYEIPAPVVTDGAGNTDCEAYYELETIEESGKYRLKVFVDEEWLEDEARVFPVEIDPTMRRFRKYKDWSALGDFVSVRSDGKTSEKSLVTGTKSKKVKKKTKKIKSRIYMRPTLPEIPKGSVVTKATLTVSVSNLSGSVKNFYAVAVPGKWSRKSIKWDNQPCNDAALKKCLKRISDYGTDGDSVSLDITRDVKNWTSGKVSYNGLCFITANENKNATKEIEPLRDSKKPFLSVTYRDFTGLEDYWSTHTQGAGSAGTGSINDYTGSLTFVHQDAKSAGERMPLCVSHVFNDTYGDRPGEEKWDDTAGTAYGEHFRLSTDVRLLVPVGETDIKKYPYVYIDSDGTKHFFKKSKVTYYVNGASKNAAEDNKEHPAAKDEDGLGLFAVPVTNADLKGKYPLKIVNKSGSTSMYFDASGYLGMITDSNQREDGKNSQKKDRNAITIEHSSQDHDGEGDKTRLRAFRDEIETYKEKTSSANDIYDACEDGIARLEAFENECLYVCVNYPAAICVQNAKIHLQNIIDGAAKSKRKEQINAALDELDKLLKKDFKAAKEKTVSVTDAAGIKSNLNYDANGRLISMTDPFEQNREITYTYDKNSYLTKITHPNGETAAFTYDDKGHLLSAKDETGKRIVYRYGTKKKPSEKVTAMREFVKKAGGQTVLINYDDYNKTAFTYTGCDEKINTDDDIENVCCFDDKGRTTGSYLRVKKTKKIIGAGSYAYSDEGSAANHLKESSAAGGPVINLLTDGSFEKKKTKAWERVDECNKGEDCHIIEKTETKKYMGSRSAHVKLTGKAEHTGRIGYRQTVTANATGYYTASVYVKACNIKNAKAVLSVEVNDKEKGTKGDEEENDETDTDPQDEVDPDDPDLYDPGDGENFDEEDDDEDTPGSQEEGTVDENTPAEFTSGWKRIETTVKVKKGQSITVGLYGEGERADIYFDCVQLEKGRVAGQYNLLPNSGFEMGSYSKKKGSKVIPAGWAYTDDSGVVDARLVTSKELGGGKNRVAEGKYALCISGNTGKKKVLVANPNFGKGKVSYTFSCYVMTSCAPVHGDRKCCIYIKGDMPEFDESDPIQKLLKDMIKEEDIAPAAYTEINTGIEGWQYVTMQLPVRDWSGKRIEIHFDKECGTLCIDGCMLTRDEVKAKTYTSSGKLKTSKDGERTTTYATNKRDLQSKETMPAGATTTYKYNKITNDLNEEAHTFTQSGKKKVDRTRYTYDRFGNPIKTLETGPSKRKLVTESVYSGDGRFEISDNNSRGYVTAYEYDTATGMVKSSTDPKGKQTLYEYNAFHDPTAVKFEGSAVSFKYEKDDHSRLETITAGTGKESIKYNFDYNSFGNVAKIKRSGSDTDLIGYSYGARNGKLKKITYGNGSTVSMRYNTLEQLTRKRYSDGNIYYYYDNKGRTARISDTKNKLGYSFNYDETGRVTDSSVYRTKKAKGESSNEIIRFGSLYDKAGRQSAFTYRYDGKTYRSKYGYTTDDKPSVTALASGGWYKTGYDNLSRTASETFISQKNKATNESKARKTGATVKTTITYLDTDRKGDEGISTDKKKYEFTTALPGVIEVKAGKKSILKESLSYDKTGRISGWNGTGYSYDGLGRLVSARDGGGREWSYEYDSVGNITKSSYFDGTDVTEDKYDYKNGNLTKFNGKSIGGYKGGNPGTYLGKKLTWERGRLLSRIGGNISYTYDLDGIRLSKTVDNKKTEYITNGSTILAEKRGGEVLNYYYSADGKLLEIGYSKNGALENHYTILRNAMGDVAGLLDPKGTLVGTYEYDPYGKLIKINHNSEYTDTDGILERNPFRYRGYYYDTETGWYYLQSRYYDPAVKRFINADTTDLLTNDCVNLMQYNLFMYCNGDPVNNTDYSGRLTDVERYFLMATTLAAFAAVLVITGGTGAIAMGAVIGVTGGAAIGFGAAGIASLLNGSDANTAISNAADGLVIGSTVGMFGGAAAGACITATTMSTETAACYANASAGVSNEKGQMLDYDLQFFAKKRDIQQIEKISKIFKIDRRAYGDFVEDFKKWEGLPSNYTFSFNRLKELARIFKNQ